MRFELGNGGGADARSDGHGVAADLAVIGGGAPAKCLGVDRGFARQEEGADAVGVAIGRPVGRVLERMRGFR